MTDQHDPRPDDEMESQVGSWLSESDLTSDEAERGLDHVLQAFPTTPQTRRRFLGRWLDRDEGARRHSDAHDHPPDQVRRNNLMLSATGVISAIAILALAVNVIDVGQTTSPGAEGGTTHTVAADGSGDFGTIQAAVDAASDGDTVLVLPGTYEEALVVDKEITLTGENDGNGDGTVISYSDNATPVLTLENSNATITSLTLNGVDSKVQVNGGAPVFDSVLFDHVGAPYRGGAGEPFRASLVISDGADTTITDNYFVGGGELRVEGGSTANIEANEFQAGAHIYLSHASDQTIVQGNTVRDPMVTGIGTTSPGSYLIDSNFITGAADFGISSPYGTTTPVIRSNMIEDIGSGTGFVGGGIGISLQANSNAEPVIEGNDVDGAATGILVEAGGGSITGNTLSGRATGVALRGGISVTDNTIDAPDIGVEVRAGEPVIDGNIICAAEPISAADTATPQVGTNEAC